MEYAEQSVTLAVIMVHKTKTKLSTQIQITLPKLPSSLSPHVVCGVGPGSSRQSVPPLRRRQAGTRGFARVGKLNNSNIGFLGLHQYFGAP